MNDAAVISAAANAAANTAADDAAEARPGLDDSTVAATVSDLQRSTSAAAPASAAGIEYPLLDAWRGLAAIAVTVHHAAGLVTRNRPELQETVLYSTSMFGWLGVQLFFVISGYCIANSAGSQLARHGSTLSFVKARLRRIYPPMWLALLLYIAMYAGGSFLASRGIISVSHDVPPMGPTSLLMNVTLAQLAFGGPLIAFVCWSLCYEVAFYLIVAAALAVGGRWGGGGGSVRTMLNLLHGLTAVTLIALIVAPQRVPYPLELWAQFGLGVIAYDLIAAPRKRQPIAAAAVVAALFVAFIARHDLPLGFMNTPSRLVSAVTLVFAAVVVLTYRRNATIAGVGFVRGLAIAGLFSYSLYLTHFWTMTVTDHALKRVPFELPHVARFAVYVSACVVGGWIFYRFCERPFVSRKRQVKHAESKNAAPAETSGLRKTAAASLVLLATLIELVNQPQAAEYAAIL